MDDPRPHVGEPLALDLLNTVWMSGDGPQDLLTDVAGVRIWLAANGLDERCRADEKTRVALVRSRRRCCGRSPTTRSMTSNTVRSTTGGSVACCTETGPREEAERGASRWLPGWLAADDLLRLLTQAPGPHQAVRP